MALKKYQKYWEILGEEDPLWAVITDKTKRMKWKEHLDEFFQLGDIEIEGIIGYLTEKGVSFNRQKALDFGCGVGRLARSLCKIFDFVIGVDISQPMLDKAIELNAEVKNCTFYLNTKPDLSIFETESFDFIYSSLVLQHIPPKFSLNYIKEFIRLLSPKGVAVFQIPFRSHHRFYKRILFRFIPKFIKKIHFQRHTGIQSHIEMNNVSKKKILGAIQSNKAKLIEFIPKLVLGDRITLNGVYIVKKYKIISVNHFNK